MLESRSKHFISCSSTQGRCPDLTIPIRPFLHGSPTPAFVDLALVLTTPHRTLFLYPLSAFFVVFCNIIGTKDHDDYELMGQITHRLSPYKQDSHLGKLLNLLQSLEQLCEPLFQEPSAASEVNSSSQRGVPAEFVTMSDNPTDSSTTGTFDPMMPFGHAMEPIIDTGYDLSADWLMWQLFNSQVPAGWLNQDFDSINI